MKTTNRILALVFVVVAMVFASCSKDKGEEPVVTIDYSKDILGMWEGVSVTGDETYGGAEIRIEYHADGKYAYFTKHLGRWCPSEDVENVYGIDGALITLKWRAEEDADYNYERWSIDYVMDGTMKWSALRERADGSRYTTTFTWKKIDTPTEEQYKTMILGKWRCYENDVYEFKGGEIVDSIINKLVGTQIWTFNTDSTFSMIHTNADGKLHLEEYGHYKMHGSVVALCYEKIIYEGEPLEIDEQLEEKLGIQDFDKEKFSMAQYVKFIDYETGDVVYDLTHVKLRRP